MIIDHLARACFPFHAHGGLEQHVYHLTLELARLGHTIRLYTQPPDPGAATVDDPAWQAQVQHFHVPYATLKVLRRNSIPDRLLNYPPFAWRLSGSIRAAQPPARIVHAHGLAGWGYACRSLPGVPLVLNPHGMEEFKNGSRTKHLAYAPFRAMLRRTARAAAAVIATDAALQPEVALFLRAGLKTTLIPNAVALDEIDRAGQPGKLTGLLNRLGLDYWQEGRFWMLSVGRLEINKGFDVMLRALSEARSQLAEIQPGWRWIVVGAGSQAAALQKLAGQLGLLDRLCWVGTASQGELHNLYELADLFVHPTRYEGSSLVTLEALAHARPVVASRTGGLPDKIFETGPFEDGRLCPPGQETALADQILEMAAMLPGRRQALGRNGRRLVEERFSWTAAARQTVDLYQRLLPAE